jgi:hypothetical protein
MRLGDYFGTGELLRGVARKRRIKMKIKNRKRT